MSTEGRLVDPWAEPAGISTMPERTFSTAMITGHRPQSLTPSEAAWSQVSITQVAWRMRSRYGMREAISGMALGADTWWAIAALASGAWLASYVPFEAQADKWSAPDQELWRALRGKAHREVVVSASGFDVRMLHARNDAMLRDTASASGLVVALFKEGSTGGTAGAVQKARAQGLPLLVLDPAAQRVSRENW